MSFPAIEELSVKVSQSYQSLATLKEISNFPEINVQTAAATTG